MDDKQNTTRTPVIDVAKRKNGKGANILELENGMKVRINSVSASLIDAVTSRIPEPEIPMWHNAQMDRDEPNPNDPKYAKALEEVGRKKGIAAIDAMVMFGIDLVDGLPEDDDWIKKLKFMEKHGQLDLTEYDLEDETDREFLYKRFVLADNDIIAKVSEASGLSAEDEAAAVKSFPGN